MLKLGMVFLGISAFACGKSGSQRAVPVADESTKLLRLDLETFCSA